MANLDKLGATEFSHTGKKLPVPTKTMATGIVDRLSKYDVALASGEADSLSSPYMDPIVLLVEGGTIRVPSAFQRRVTDLWIQHRLRAGRGGAELAVVRDTSHTLVYLIAFIEVCAIILYAYRNVS